MGFYIRKALRVGPLRFNLSKSGVGMSVGVRGLRLGAGPRGTYVHMGRGGLYFRKTLNAFRGKASVRSDRLSEPGLTKEPHDTAKPLEDLGSGPVLTMVDASSAELLREMNEKMTKAQFFPIVLVFSIIVVLLLVAIEMPAALIVSLSVFAIGFCWLAAMRDALRKTTVILYHLEPEIETAYSRLHEAFAVLCSCSRIWHIEAQGRVVDRKYHAGASGVVKRKQVTLTIGAPPFVKTNIKVPLVPVGKQLLAFMPDRLLVFDSEAVGAISYSDLTLKVAESRLIEEEALPQDATVVGKTWRYVNKNGGPDRRFKDNREIPICAYEQIHLLSNTGLNEMLLVSRRGASNSLIQALSSMWNLQTDESSASARSQIERN